MRISLLIPSYQRVEVLRQCLQALRRQTLAPVEAILCLRVGDVATHELVRGFEGLPAQIAETAMPGVIAAMNAGLRQTRGEIVALLDDDALPHPDWLERIARYFGEDPRLSGVGGIDLQTNPAHRKRGDRDLRVGCFTWYGRPPGNHHLGSGPAQTVQVLKGCNSAYRGDFLRRVGFDRKLRGAGAQVGWEISLGLDVLRENGRLIYDPAIRVDHLIAPRQETDRIHRGHYDAASAYDIAWNLFSIVHRKAPFSLRVRIYLWELLVGSAVNPGVLRVLSGRRASWREGLGRMLVNYRAFWRRTTVCEREKLAA